MTFTEAKPEGSRIVRPPEVKTLTEHLRALSTVTADVRVGKEDARCCFVNGFKCGEREGFEPYP